MKTKETNPTRQGSPTPCKQALRRFKYNYSRTSNNGHLSTTAIFFVVGKSIHGPGGHCRQVRLHTSLLTTLKRKDSFFFFFKLTNLQESKKIDRTSSIAQTRSFLFKEMTEIPSPYKFLRTPLYGAKTLTITFRPSRKQKTSKAVT